ncbi:LiaI-LiaF-like domain-containing protein [Uliginosibacterium aquaticum]|uniref:LiaI-LiaF-like transmembrane region domain-containing protein n=1 Tax=Uliginosibacterium aquaticum TaxID=2731212 RepID=A0ABX2IF04_9RHOO|nr:DUF5668 domain-containing protein [Uliginosibacterium aquaticum]NSL55203.1 hypothetical protein [Uliginosibacterium aquaticum]
MSRFGSIALIVVGCLFLLSNLGLFRFSQVAQLLHTWWPLILIAVGVLGLLGKKG